MGYDNDIKWSSYMKRQCEFIWRMWLVGAWSANEDLGEQIEAEDIRSQSREWHVWGYTGPITYRKIERVPLLIQPLVQGPYQALLIALSINDFWAARRAAGAIYQAVQGYRKINFPRIYAPKWKKGAPSLEEIGLLVPKEIGAAERCITMFDKEYANEKTPHYGHVEPEQYKFFVHKASMRGNYVYVHPNEGDAIRLPRPMVHALPNHMLEGTGPGVPTEAPGPPAPGEGEEDEGGRSIPR